MIYTVTLNPSLDYMVTVENFSLGMTNRTSTESMLPGGKGINVSTMLRNLGFDSTAIGFTAGFTGREIERLAGERGICSEFVRLEEGVSRINIKLTSIDGTEINGAGPNISEAALESLKQRLDRLCDGDMLVLAGSIPSSVPQSIYADIMKRLEAKGVDIIVDTAGKKLLDVLKYRPFLVKPNQHELGELFNVAVETRECAAIYAQRLRQLGARNVLVSMGGDGAVLAAEDGNVYLGEAPRGRVVNSVGAGDSMVAGFIAGWLEEKSCRHAFYMGIAAGSASAFSSEFADRKTVEELCGSME